MELSENSRMLLEHLRSLGDACVGERHGTHYIIPKPSFNWDGRLAPPRVEHPECLQELVDGGYLIFGEHDVGNPTSDYATMCWGHQNRVYSLTKKGRQEALLVS